MPTWKLKIQYDGTRYSGWQQQPNGRTVQGELIKVANSIFSDIVDIGGAGRTDAGVHALEQVAHLRAKKNLSIKHLQINFDQLLPKDININKIEMARDDFDARHDAISRYYLYQISLCRTAFGKPYVWWIKDRLNIDLMQQACHHLIGLHDFQSFCEMVDRKSTLVKVENAAIKTTDNLVLFRISASHFLWKMVRRIVGTLVEIGRENITLKEFTRFFMQKSDLPAKYTAPSSGLFLEKIIYPSDTRPDQIYPAYFYF